MKIRTLSEVILKFWAVLWFFRELCSLPQLLLFIVGRPVIDPTTRMSERFLVVNITTSSSPR
jgi:hypothetical protein